MKQGFAWLEKSNWRSAEVEVEGEKGRSEEGEAEEIGSDENVAGGAGWAELGPAGSWHGEVTLAGDCYGREPLTRPGKTTRQFRDFS